MNENFENKPCLDVCVFAVNHSYILWILPKNEILGLEADSLKVIPGDGSSIDENDLNEVFFNVKNHPFYNQLDFAYYLGPLDKCSIQFSFLCEKIIDISTIEKMNIQGRI